MKVRRLTDKGIEDFTRWLKDNKNNANPEFPMQLLTNKDTSEEVISLANVELNNRVFGLKSELANYLDILIDEGLRESLIVDTGFWAALALFFNESICPIINGKRKLGDYARYIFLKDNYQRSYRHLIRTPFIYLTEIKDHTRIYLNQPPSIHGDMIEQTAGRLYILRNKGVRELIDKLFYDEKKGTWKRGTLGRRKGSLDRFITRVEQLSINYDLESFSALDNIQMLGDEFAEKVIPPVIK